MKPTELRIGNFVYDENGHVHEITGHDLWSWEFANFREIPLNDERLRRFGFDNPYSNKSEYTIEAGLRSFTIEHSDDWYYFTGGEGVHFSEPIQYVHQLQNIYFALRNEEITMQT